MSMRRAVMIFGCIFCLMFKGYAENECQAIKRLSVGGEWLYLSPSGGPTDFASIIGGTDEAPTFTQVFVDPDYRSGYRVFANYLLNEIDTISFIYTHYDHSFSKFVSAPGAILPVDVSGFVGILSNDALGRIKYDYSAYEVDIGRNCCWGECLTTKLFAGLRYVDLVVENHSQYMITTGGLLIHDICSDFCGIGPLIGLEGTYHFRCSFAIIGRASVGLLAGSHDLFSLGINPDVMDFSRPTNREDDKHTLVPFIDLSFALQYRLPFRCFPCDLQAGYLLIYYNDAYKRSASGVDGRPIAANNVDFRGAFVRLSASIW